MRHSLALVTCLFLIAACEDAEVTEVEDALDTFTGTCTFGETPCSGACADLLTSVEHCGACGTPCNAGEVCTFGSCRACAEGESVCEGVCFDLSRSDRHCGTCGQSCSFPTECIEGLCTVLCEEGLTSCDQACVDTESNPDHCGACDNTCAPNETCCGGSCADLTTSMRHCGQCSNRCLAVGERCMSGTCEAVCGEAQCVAGELCCDEACVLPESDATHCGGCFISCQGGGACDAGQCPDGEPVTWPPAGDYLGDSGTFIHTLTIPPLDETTKVPTCCKDFGERSADFILNGTQLPDNALAGLAAELNGLVDFQDIVNTEIAEDRLNILLDHRGIENTTSDAFVLVELLGKRNTGTTFEDARGGLGEFRVLEQSFDERGIPRVVFNPATVNNDTVIVLPGTLQVVIPLGVIALPFTLREAVIEGDVIQTAAGVEYTRGTLSGYLLVDDFFESLNAYASTFCDCLELGDQALYEFTDDDKIIPHCVPQATARCGEGSNCAAVGGNNVLEFGVCALLLQLVQNAADIDIDGDTSNFEALSLSFEFVGAPARITADDTPPPPEP